MTQSGWYPDPAGRPGHLRRWDGQQWTHELRGPDGELVVDHDTSTGSGRPTPWGWLGLLTLLLVAAVVVWQVRGGSDSPGGEDTNSSTPTVSGWDETSTPSASPTPSDATRSPSGASTRPCPVLRNERQDHPRDGRLHGGGLVVDVPAGFQETGPSWGRFMTDHAAASRHHAGSSWYSLASVGRVPRADFPNVKQAGALVIQCHTSSGNFTGRTGGEVLRSEAVTIGGKSGWRHREKVLSATAPGGHVITEITTVDLGDPDWLSIYWAGWVGADTASEQALEANWSTLGLG